MNYLFRSFSLVGYIIVFLVVSSLVGGCADTSSNSRWQPVVRHEDNKVHVVKWPDETLPAIASWYTGSRDQATTIANANPTLDPARLQQGERIFIPQNILKTRGDMSRSFLDVFLSPPALTVKTSSGVSISKDPRVIIPRPYKEKKEDGVAGLSVPAPEKGDIQLEPSPGPANEEEPSLYLFGPR